MKVAVTGGTGFLGSHLVPHLLGVGFRPRVLARPSSDRESHSARDIDWVTGDIQERATLEGVFENCDLLFHMAGIFSYWNTEDIVTKAIEGTKNVLEEAARQGVKRVVITSSSVSVGASRQPRVLAEESGVPPLADDPAYVLSKRRQETISFDLGAKLGLEVLAVCPGLVIGGPDPRLSEGNRLILNYLKDPWKCTWIGGGNLVHVADVAQAHLLVAEKGQPGQRYLAGSENYSWAQIHGLISELAGVPGPYLTANHTASYLASLYHELRSRLTGEYPAGTREQAKMVGNYYWYTSDKLGRLGYQPRPVRDSLVDAIAWLLSSDFIPSSIRSEMKLSEHLRAHKAAHWYELQDSVRYQTSR